MMRGLNNKKQIMSVYGMVFSGKKNIEPSLPIISSARKGRSILPMKKSAIKMSLKTREITSGIAKKTFQHSNAIVATLFIAGFLL
jgi:hypothetical protein